MNAWARGFLGRDDRSPTGARSSTSPPGSSARAGCTSTTGTCGCADGAGFSASIVDLALYVVNNQRRAAADGRARIVLYLPKIQTAEEAALWNRMLSALEAHLALPEGTIKVYVLVEQLEACFQLMEIRAALGRHFVGFNTGRWDYINSVSDAMAWDAQFVNPNIDAITMTYGYMRNYEDRVRRAVNTPDRDGQLRAVAGRHGAEHPGRLRAWRRQRDGARGRRRRARAARGRQRQVGRALEDGAHRPAGLGAASAQDNQLGRRFPAAHLHRRRTPPAWCCSSRRRAPCGARATCSAWRCSTATPSARASRRRR